MYEKDPVTSPIFPRETVADEAEQAVETPHFLDQAVVEHAQPAVPLAEIKRKRSWPTPIIVAALLFGLAVGAFGSMLYMRERNQAARTATQAQTPPVVASNPETVEPTVSAATEDASIPETEKQKVAVNKQERATESVRAESSSVSEAREMGRAEIAVAPSNEDAAALRGALNDWVAATNARDINKQMSFYNPTVNSFYLSRNASREDVRAEKARVFARAQSIDIRAADPQIKVSPDGNTATMRFRKQYAIEGGGQDRRGAVVQELRWKRAGGQWRIVSERDVKVLQE
jgi:ketosteroid isomerase-like protein